MVRWCLVNLKCPGVLLIWIIGKQRLTALAVCADLDIFVVYLFSLLSPSPLERPDRCWLVVLGLTPLADSISVYIGPSPREREKEERKDRGE